MASTTLTRLDSLPAEIIKRIASFSPTTSVLALFLVNRRLRAVCNDVMVFRSIISHQNNQDNQYLRDNEEGDWSPPPTTTEHARYALADLRAREWVSLPHNNILCYGEIKLDPAMNLCCEDDYQKAILWAPKLASLHHPFVNSLNIFECLDKLLPTRPEVARLGLNFILTKAILAQLSTQIRRMETFENLRIIKSTLAKQLSSPYSLDHNPNVALIALSLFIFSEKNARSLSIPLPSPFKIPFPADFLPIPFSEITCQDFTTSHLREMTSKSYLEEGEWVGYYSYNSDLSYHVPFDPPMTGIHLTVVPTPHESEADVQTMQITAQGRDKVGTFRLEGKISSTGEVKCKKIYDLGSWWWDWNATMTPFGIVGNWGRNEAWDQDGQGCLWLWKMKWSE